ncbi:MAG: zinc ribbon domain-containing protein [Phycisphaerae bacterium]|nr:zinc ribbon domain-containing protein [Phycisphaerae bacterium]
MSLKIRCPHCRRVLVAEDEVAGRRKACPACGRQFEVPLRLPAAPSPSVIGPKCPHCGTEAAPNARYCHKCFTDLETGKRLPLKQRLRLMSGRSWAAAVFAVAVVGLVVFVGVQWYRIRSQPAAATVVPTTPVEPLPATELAGDLLAASNSEERSAALQRLQGVELRVAPAVAAALEASLAQPGDDPQIQLSRIAAIDLLARNGEAHPQKVPAWLAALERCQQDRALYEVALRARALLGDAGVRDDLAEVWLAELERLLFIARLVQLSGTDRESDADLMAQRTRNELKRCADGLRRLAQDEENLVFERLAEAYWDSWQWLGQGPGDGFAKELFDLASPTEGTLEFDPDDVRKPRDAMKRVTQRGTPAARAAAGVVLKERVPQYSRLCARIAATLGELLPDCDALDQQRLTWTIARLRGQVLGHTPRSSPLDVTAAEIATVQEWVRPGVEPVLHGPFASPPLLIRRVATAERQLERELLVKLKGGWLSANSALDRWLAANLGCTPRLKPLLNPGQRRPDYPALAAALVIVAVSGDESYRPQLELWHEATDQPPWVRALAYTVLGSFDARSRRWRSRWPAGLYLGDPALLEAGSPHWDHFGRVLAAGGPVMMQRLRDFNPPPLSAEVQSKLMEAARQTAERYGPPGTP